MKKYNFSKIAAICAVVAVFGAVFMLSACGENPPGDSIVGRYQYESVTIQATEEADWMRPAAEGSVFEITDDTRGVFTFQGEEIGFTYSRVGNNITVRIIFRNNPQTTWSGVLDGVRITLDVRFNAYTMMRTVYRLA